MKHKSPKRFLDRLADALQKVYEKVSEERESSVFKIYTSLSSTFYQAADPSTHTDPPPTFNTDPSIILPVTNIQDVIDHFYQNLLHQIGEYEGTGSGWVL